MDNNFKEFVIEDFEYDRIATQEELAKLSNEEIKTLSKEARISPIVAHPDTSESMAVIDRVAYVLKNSQ